MEKEISKNYMNPTHPVSFTAKNAQKNWYKNIPFRKISKEMDKIRPYRETRQYKKPHQWNPIFVTRTR